MDRVRVSLGATLSALAVVMLLPALDAAAAISGVTLRLDEDTTNGVRLRFEVCGADVTQLSGAGLPVTFRFDTPVTHVGVHVGRTSLAPEAHVTGQTATVSLRRDPFTPPEPWRIVIVIDVARLPTAGSLTLGAWPAHNLAPELAAASGQARVVVGVGCDDVYAAQQGPPGVPQTSYRSPLPIRLHALLLQPLPIPANASHGCSIPPSLVEVWRRYWYPQRSHPVRHAVHKLPQHLLALARQSHLALAAR